MKENFETKLKKELEVFKKLDHPHIYTVYDFYQDENNYYLVSEYLEGGELFDYLSKRKHFTEKELFQVMKIILSTINYLHSQNIIYRDIKPENFVFGTVGDF